MAKLDELAAQVEALQRVLRQHGIVLPAETEPGGHSPDYLAHGSPEHAALLGLVEVKDGDSYESLARYTSPRSGRTYRLEDEMGAIRHYPGIDPAKGALLVLQQKVNELETAPEPPRDAPPPFKPAAVYPS